MIMFKHVVSFHKSINICYLTIFFDCSNKSHGFNQPSNKSHMINDINYFDHKYY
jgi:hypothetical protein